MNPVTNNAPLIKCQMPIANFGIPQHYEPPQRAINYWMVAANQGPLNAFANIAMAHQAEMHAGNGHTSKPGV